MMKRFILLIGLVLITAVSFGQVRKAMFTIPDSTTVFGITLPSGSIVFDNGANRLWKLTAAEVAGDNLQTSSKELIAEAGGGFQNLANVLGVGDTMSNGQVIKAANGGSQINLRNGADNVFDITNDNGGYLKAWYYGDDSNTWLGFGSASDIISNATGVIVTGNTIELKNTPLGTKVGIYKQTNNEISIGLNDSNTPYNNDEKSIFIPNADLSDRLTGTNNKFSTAIATKNGTIKQDVINSASLGGINTIVKTSEVGYVNRLAFNIGGTGETVLEHDVTSTTDRLITLPDTSGTVALTLDIAAASVDAKSNINQPIPNNFFTPVLLQTENYDTDNFHKTTNETSGTATSGGAGVVSDGGAAWTTNQFQNMVVRITSGTGSGQVRLIASNTDTTITISGSWTTTPDATSGYEVLITNRLTVPAGQGGKYLVSPKLTMSGNATGIRGIAIYKGTTFINSVFGNPVGVVETIVPYASFVMDLAPGDWIEMRAYQTSGGVLNTLGSSNYKVFLQLTKLQ